MTDELTTQYLYGTMNAIYEQLWAIVKITDSLKYRMADIEELTPQQRKALEVLTECNDYATKSMGKASNFRTILKRSEYKQEDYRGFHDQLD